MTDNKVLHPGRGGIRQGQGRPKGSKNKHSGLASKGGRLVISCSESEMNQIKEMAKDSGKTISRFVIERILST